MENTQITPADISSELITIKQGKTITTSLEVAKVFGKMHKNVLRDIQNLECSEEFNRRNFAPVKYTDEKGEKRPMFEMTRDGFTILVMGYTGRKAMVFKEKYIAAFNYMEELLLHDARQTKALFDKLEALVRQPSHLSPVGQFVTDRCSVRADAIIMKKELYNAYQYYSLKNFVVPLSRSRFFNSLYLTVGGVKSVRRTIGGTQIPCVTGIRLIREALNEARKLIKSAGPEIK